MKRTLFALFTLLVGSAHADTWIPTPASALKGNTVKLVVYDLRPTVNRLQVRLENGVDYVYPFNPSDAVQVAKAGAIYSTMMAARSAKELVSIFVTGEATTNPTIISVQYGPNP